MFVHFISKVSCSFSFVSDHLILYRKKLELRPGISIEERNGSIRQRETSLSMPCNTEQYRKAKLSLIRRSRVTSSITASCVSCEISLDCVSQEEAWLRWNCDTLVLFEVDLKRPLKAMS